MLAAQISLQLASQLLAVGPTAIAPAEPLPAVVASPAPEQTAPIPIAIPTDVPTQAAPVLASSPDGESPISKPAKKLNFHDPLAPLNRISYAITQPIDRFVLRPAAMVYKTIIPKFLRLGIRNALNNLHEPLVVVNDLLQLRPKRALHTTGRFVINSTAGLAGTIDVAKNKPFYAPSHANSAGDTLGYYGMGPLVYMYLPVLGPTTLRDFVGEFGDNFVNPRLLYRITHPASKRSILKTQLSFGKYSQGIQITSGLDQRAEADDDLKRMKADAVDPYANLRANFLQDRAGEIAWLRAKDGEQTQLPGFDDPLDDPEAKSAPAVTAAAVANPVLPLQKGP